MKIYSMFFILLNIALGWFCSCSKDDDGSKMNSNPFENNGSESVFATVTCTSNADSVFFTLKPSKDSLSYDHYLISSNKLTNKLSIPRESKRCVLTHFPYNEAVPVSIEAVKNGKSIDTLMVYVMISGLDTVFSGKLIPDFGSVTGGDGMYSIPLPDGRSIFLMGDSYLGTVSNGARSMQEHMYRNSYILYNQGKVTPVVGANNSLSSAAVPPGVTDEGKKWYWPGHGFVQDNKLFIFQTLMYQGDAGMWGFKYETTDILEYSLPDLKLQKTTNIPFKGSTDVHYGMACINDDGTVYVYAQVDVSNGTNAVSEVLVARTTPSNLYTKWEYFNGTGWSDNSSEAVKLSGLSSVAVSSQFNVFKLNGKYVLLTQEKQLNAGTIYTFIADAPQGPWYNKKLIYRTSEQNKPNLLTYNAMAHPQFMHDGMMLVSYNVNTMDFNQQHTDVSTYRPRFFWVDVNTILKN